MAKRFFTADWHLGMQACLTYDKRAKSLGGLFDDIEDMNNTLLNNANKLADKNDTIFHIGDLASFKLDRGQIGLSEKPIEIIKKINANFINIHGNHDDQNKVISLCDSMQIHLGKRYPNVCLCHFPSYDRRAVNKFFEGCIILCGHVHGKWKHCLDLDNSVLNINVGVDVWNYTIVSEETLLKYINLILKVPKYKLTKIKKIDGKIFYV